MRIDLHNHTPLCNHASGTPKAYIQQAINNNIDHFGFSDHAPMHFDQKYRMDFTQMPLYERDILHLKEQFKDQITILLGYEVDFLDGYIDESVLRREVDYLIGSVHFLGKWGFDNPEFIGGFASKDIDHIWQEYFDSIEALANSGLFQIVGHLDLIKVFKFLPKKDVRLIAKNAIKAIKKADLVVEINAAGLRKPISEAYPSCPLMELLSEQEIPITFGSDAHEVLHVGFAQEEILAYAKNYGYKKCATFSNKERKMVNF
ncbi:MAG: histidinol-phosphatase [Sulfurospirillum sp.]|nr:histidinol-phosphatase [Sulfurospirillum sp.]